MDIIKILNLIIPIIAFIPITKITYYFGRELKFSRLTHQKNLNTARSLFGLFLLLWGLNLYSIVHYSFVITGMRFELMSELASIRTLISNSAILILSVIFNNLTKK